MFTFSPRDLHAAVGPKMGHDEKRALRPGEEHRDPGESESSSQKLHIDLHRKYIVALQDKRNTFGELLANNMVKSGAFFKELK